MAKRHSNSFSIDLSESIRDVPAEVDVRATYGEVTINEFAKQHGIDYLGLPFEWDDEDQGWRFALDVADVALFTRFIEGLGAMDFDGLQWDENDSSDELQDGVLAVYRFRAAPGD